VRDTFYREMIKSVPRMARRGRARRRPAPSRAGPALSARLARARHVYLSALPDRSRWVAASSAAIIVAQSPVYYGVRSAASFTADIGLDVLRVYFPQRWNLWLAPAGFTRNAGLKLLKHAASGACSLLLGSLVPFLPGIVAHPVAFILSDLIATTVVDMLVSGQFGPAE
jgi:hypothetical protein